MFRSYRPHRSLALRSPLDGPPARPETKRTPSPFLFLPSPLITILLCNSFKRQSGNLNSLGTCNQTAVSVFHSREFYGAAFTFIFFNYILSFLLFFFIFLIFLLLMYNSSRLTVAKSGNGQSRSLLGKFVWNKIDSKFTTGQVRGVLFQCERPFYNPYKHFYRYRRFHLEIHR